MYLQGGGLILPPVFQSAEAGCGFGGLREFAVRGAMILGAAPAADDGLDDFGGQALRRAEGQGGVGVAVGMGILGQLQQGLGVHNLERGQVAALRLGFADEPEFLQNCQLAGVQAVGAPSSQKEGFVRDSGGLGCGLS